MNSFDDTFVQTAYTHPVNAHRCKFIHPIFETKDKLFHLPENIFNEFLLKDFHLEPLLRFVEYFEDEISWEELLKKLEDIPDNGGGEIISLSLTK